MADTIIRVDEVSPADRGNTANIFKDAAGTSIIGSTVKGRYVQVIEDAGSMRKIKNGNSNGYMRSADLKKGQELGSQQQNRTAQQQMASTSAGSNQDYQRTRKTYTEEENKAYDFAQTRYMRAFGRPPHFNMDTDIQYDDVARVVFNTIAVNPAILSICPGAVDFLPGWNKDEKDTFFETVKNAATGNGDLDNQLASDQLNQTGKLYQFKSAYADYVNVFNALCRACAVLLGIGDEVMPTTSVKLKNFDYGYWTQRNQFKFDSSNGTSIFSQFWEGAMQTLQSAVNDNVYLHYFITNAESSYSESVSTGVEPSALEAAINQSDLNSLAKNLNYLFGGAVGDMTASGMFQDLKDTPLFAGDGFLSRIGNASINYLNGARMVIPDMLGDIQWDKSISCSLTFMSPYGDPEAIFFNCIVPVCSLLTFAYPKQISENMYTYPFIVRVYEQGWYMSDLAVINNIQVTRGGQDDTSWTWDGLATEWNVSFQITPLYNELMVTSSRNPLLFFGNDSLLQYLGNMCGLDLKTDNMATKKQLALELIQNKVKDIPENYGRRMGELFANMLRPLFQWQSG